MTVATTERTRLDALREQEAKLAEQVEEKRARIAEYPDKIATAREGAWYLNQKKRPLAVLNSPLQKLIDVEKADVAALNGLQADLSAIRNVIAQEDVRVREAESAEARAQLELMLAEETVTWEQAGEAFAGLVSVWNKYVSLAEESSKFAQENGLDGGTAVAVSPAPASFRTWLLLLLSAATDEDVRAEPRVEQLTDSGIFGTDHGPIYDARPAGTRTIETRRRLDDQDRLYRLIPDLRGIVHKLQLSGRVPTVTSE